VSRSLLVPIGPDRGPETAALYFGKHRSLGRCRVDQSIAASRMATLLANPAQRLAEFAGCDRSTDMAL